MRAPARPAAEQVLQVQVQVLPQVVPALLVVQVQGALAQRPLQQTPEAPQCWPRPARRQPPTGCPRSSG